MPRRIFARSVVAFCALVGAAVIAPGTSAEATVFNFSISGADTGSGTLTSADTSSPFVITGITGIFDGSNITGLSTLGGANNKVYEPAPFLDDFGLSFSVAGGPDVNVFFNDPTYFVQVRGGAQLDQVTFTLTAVPEPGSLSLLGTALIGFGSFKLRRFRRNVRGDASRRLARPELC